METDVIIDNIVLLRAGLGDFVGMGNVAGDWVEVGEGAGGAIGGGNRFRELELGDLGLSGCGWTLLSMLSIMLVTWSLEMMEVGLFDCMGLLDGGGGDGLGGVGFPSCGGASVLLGAILELGNVVYNNAGTLGAAGGEHSHLGVPSNIGDEVEAKGVGVHESSCFWTK